MAEAQKINNLQTRDSVSAIGDLVITLNSEPQPGRLFMNGETHNKYAYPQLWEHVVNNPAYGTYTTNNFTLTDMRGRVPVGQSASGTFSTLGDTMGAETHTLTSSQVPATQVTDGDGGAVTRTTGTYGWPTGTYNMVYGASSGLNLKVNGGGQAHNNIQPSIVVNYEVKAA